MSPVILVLFSWLKLYRLVLHQTSRTSRNNLLLHRPGLKLRRTHRIKPGPRIKPTLGGAKAPENAPFYPASSTRPVLEGAAGAVARRRRVQRMALMYRAVKAVDFIGWRSAYLHFGVDAGGKAVCTTLRILARPHHPLPAPAVSVCETPICRLTRNPKSAAGPAMSWWSHLKHWLIMPKPPPVVCRARAFELLWLRHAFSGTLG